MRLHVVVHAEHVVTVRVVHGTHKAVMLAEIAHEANAVDILIQRTQTTNLPERSIG